MEVQKISGTSALNDLRKEVGLTFDQLSKHTGLSYPTVYSICTKGTGDIKNINKVLEVLKNEQRKLQTI